MGHRIRSARNALSRSRRRDSAVVVAARSMVILSSATWRTATLPSYLISGSTLLCMPVPSMGRRRQTVRDIMVALNVEDRLCQVARQALQTQSVGAATTFSSSSAPCAGTTAAITTPLKPWLLTGLPFFTAYLLPTNMT